MSAAEVQARVREAVAAQPIMAALGVQVVHAAPGEIDLASPFDERLTQQHGFLHAGVLTTVVDSACGYAAWSASDVDADVLTVELKINLLEPAAASRFVARGRVVRAGRRLTTCRGEVITADGSEERLIAITTTTIALRPRNG